MLSLLEDITVVFLLWSSLKLLFSFVIVKILSTWLISTFDFRCSEFISVVTSNGFDITPSSSFVSVFFIESKSVTISISSVSILSLLEEATMSSDKFSISLCFFRMLEIFSFSKLFSILVAASNGFDTASFPSIVFRFL